MRAVPAIALALFACKGKSTGAPARADAAAAPPVAMASDAFADDEEATAVEPDPAPPTPTIRAATEGFGPGVLGSVHVTASGKLVYCGFEDDGVDPGVETVCEREDGRDVLLTIDVARKLDAQPDDQRRAVLLERIAAVKRQIARTLPRACEVLTGDDPPCTALGRTITIDDQGTVTVAGPTPFTETFAPVKGPTDGCAAELRSADVFVDARGQRLAIVAHLSGTGGDCAVLSRSKLRVVGP